MLELGFRFGGNIIKMQSWMIADDFFFALADWILEQPRAVWLAYEAG
jgi:hypothetical protein